MPCDGCNKPKTVHVTEIKGGKKVEQHLCKDCPHATDDVPAGKGGKGGKGSKHQPINELLTNFVLATTNAAQQSDACPHTGLTWQEFRNTGLLGHPDNYALFDKQLTPLLQRAHEGATHHVGKRPDKSRAGNRDPITAGRNQARREVAKLRRELALAVESEDYELAAQLRDQLKAAEAATNDMADSLNEAGETLFTDDADDTFTGDK
jgi:protein arginine kinase activator